MLGHASALRTCHHPPGAAAGSGISADAAPALARTARAPLSCPLRKPRCPASLRCGSVALTRLLPDETDTQPTTPLAPPSALTVMTRALVPRRVSSRLTPHPLLSRARSWHRPLPPGPQRSGSAPGTFQLEDLCFKKQLRFLQRRKENKTKHELRVYSWTFIRCSPALPRSHFCSSSFL